MKPQEFLEVADEWVAGIREAEWRSAVTRAYYAAFHVARDLLQRCGFVVPQGEQAHAYLWLSLSNSNHPDVKLAGGDLNYLRSLRNRADYDLDQPFPHTVAVGQVQAADEIIKLFDAIPTTPTVQAQITTAIKDYEQRVLGQNTWQP
jgi:uncharacterized protein (UPF0332 family)